ncbi:MAG: hypothetical protein FWG96_06725 [Methanomassiliicoccaceae archaeon]|nr:hypothetical protein [Methanomassiliicoccaceae archaeon]
MEKLAHKIGKINRFNYNYFIRRYDNQIKDLCEGASKFKYEWKDSSSDCRMGIFYQLGTDSKNENEARVLYDIYLENHSFHERRSYEQYNESQPLFQAFPELFEKISKQGSGEYLPRNIFDDCELRGGKYVDDGVRFGPFIGVSYKGHCFEYLEKDKMIQHIEKTYGNNYLLHIDPYFVHNLSDISYYKEAAVIRPIDPKCISNFRLQKKYTGGEYDCSQKNEKLEDLPEYKSTFQSQNDARLEVIIKTKNRNDMEMYIEEVHLDNFRQRVIGRFIHCIINDAYGKDLGNMNLNHLDFSINVYLEDRAEQRWISRLSNGEDIVKATYRTHALRLDGIPFFGLITCAYFFIKKTCLALEWIYNQFGMDILNLNLAK